MKEVTKKNFVKIKVLFILTITIIAIFSVACQTTPEKLVVQNKADDDLQQAIVQTAEPTEQIISQIESTQETYQPINIQDISSNASNTVTVEIDAEVVNNQPDSIPVVKLEPREFTEDELKQMMQAFFGNTQLYSRELTKEDYDEWIINKQLELNDEEKLQAYADNRSIKDLNEARNQIQEAIDRLKSERQNAADTRVPVDYGDFYSENGLNLFVDTNKGFLGNVKANKDSIVLTAFNDNNSYYLERNYIPSGSINLNTSPDAQYLEAKQIAVDLASEINVETVLGDSYLVNDYRDDPSRQFFVFCFEMKIDETSIDHTLDYGNISDAAADEEVYEILREYERFEVWIEKDQLVQIKYHMPMKTTEVLNSNVAISIDYEKAMELAKQQAYVQYVDTYGNYTEAKIDVNKIELIMARTKEKNNGDYIIVPAWRFDGTLSRRFKDTEHRPDADENGWVTHMGNGGFGSSLIVINALDGTLIDMGRGY